MYAALGLIGLDWACLGLFGLPHLRLVHYSGRQKRCTGNPPPWRVVWRYVQIESMMSRCLFCLQTTLLGNRESHVQYGTSLSGRPVGPEEGVSYISTPFFSVSRFPEILCLCMFPGSTKLQELSSMSVAKNEVEGCCSTTHQHVIRVSKGWLDQVTVVRRRTPRANPTPANPSQPNRSSTDTLLPVHRVVAPFGCMKLKLIGQNEFKAAFFSPACHHHHKPHHHHRHHHLDLIPSAAYGLPQHARNRRRSYFLHLYSL